METGVEKAKKKRRKLTGKEKEKERKVVLFFGVAHD
jgi:hypothetical protein